MRWGVHGFQFFDAMGAAWHGGHILRPMNFSQVLFGARFKAWWLIQEDHHEAILISLAPSLSS
jgi:hypothetical protein